MKKTLSLLVLLLISPFVVVQAEQQPLKGCTLRLASLTLFAVGGASLEAAYPQVGRTAFVTDLTGDPAYDSAGNLILNGNILDGNGLTQGVFCSGNVCINPQTNKIRSLRFRRGEHSGNYSPSAYNQMAIDAALWVMNANRPDMGSYTSVPQVDDLQWWEANGLQLEQSIEGRSVSWKRVVIRNGQTGGTDGIYVAIDRANASPIAGVEVRKAWWDWETDQGTSALASMIGRIAADAAMPSSGLRLGNFVTDMTGSDYWGQTQSGVVYRGSDSGGNPLARFTARFADSVKGMIDSVSIRSIEDSRRPISWAPNELQPLLRSMALGLHKLIRLDAGRETRITDFVAPRYSEVRDGENVFPWVVTVYDNGSPEKRPSNPNFNYEVIVRPDLAHPIRGARRVN